MHLLLTIIFVVIGFALSILSFATGYDTNCWLFHYCSPTSHYSMTFLSVLFAVPALIFLFLGFKRVFSKIDLSEQDPIKLKNYAPNEHVE